MKSKSRKLDDLTGLYTRSFLKPYVNDLIEDRKSFSLFLLDIDFFKMINDSFGHMRGDEVLRDVADILKKSVQNKGVVIRYGGDEFIIIVTDKSLMDSFEGYIDDIVFHREFAGDPPVRISFTMGSATYPGDGKDLFNLLKCADDILLKAKRKNHYGIRFVGRENVLSVLKSGLEEASRGNSKFVHLVGIEGVGKTRILSELLIYANLAGFNTTLFNCKRNFGYEPLQFLTGDKSFNPTWKVINSISPSISGRPVFWCIDDIDSCSMETRKFLEKMPTMMSKEKFFLILSGKEDIGMNQFLKINLEPLDIYGTKDFVSSFIGVQDIDDSLVAYLFDKTGGIPGKLLSTLNNLLNNNVIKLEKNRVQMDKVNDTDIEGHLFKAYKKLRKEERMIFQVGALLGDIGNCGLIADILETSYDEVCKTREFGLSIGLLKPSANFIISTEELRKKLYKGIGNKRKELHRKAGEILSKRVYPGPSAYQFEMARDFENAANQSLLLVRSLLDKGLLIDAEGVLRELKKWTNEEWFDRKKFYERWGDIFYKKGEFRNALEMFNKAIENKKDMDIIKKIGILYAKMGNMKDAFNTLESIREYALPVIAEVFLAVGDFKRAREYAQESLKLSKKMEDQMRAFAALGALEYSEKKFQSALNYYRNGIAIAYKLNDNYWTSIFQNRMGAIYYSRGDLDEARKYYNKALKGFIELADTDSIPSLYMNIGLIYEKESILKEALKHYEYALGVAEKIENSSLIGSINYFIADLLFEIGDTKNIKNYLDKALENLRKAHILPNLSSTYVLLGRIEIKEGNDKKASTYFNRTRKIVEKYGYKDVKYELEIGEAELLIKGEMYKDADRLLKRLENKITNEKRGEVYRLIAIVKDRLGDSLWAKKYGEKAINSHKIYGTLWEIAKDYNILSSLSAFYEKAGEYRELADEIFRRCGIEKGFEEFI